MGESLSGLQRSGLRPLTIKEGLKSESTEILEEGEGVSVHENCLVRTLRVGQSRKRSVFLLFYYLHRVLTRNS